MSKDEIDFDTLPSGHADDLDEDLANDIMNDLPPGANLMKNGHLYKNAQPHTKIIDSIASYLDDHDFERAFMLLDSVRCEDHKTVASALHQALESIMMEMRSRVLDEEPEDEDEDEVPSSEDDLLAQKAFANIIRSCVDDIEIKISFKK